jgi:hypothetical protein
LTQREQTAITLQAMTISKPSEKEDDGCEAVIP